MAVLAASTLSVLNLQSKIALLSERAYVTIGQKDGTVAEIIPSTDATQSAQIILYFKNSGHIPAQLSWGAEPMEPQPPFGLPTGITGTHQFKPITETRNKKDGSLSYPNGPGQSIAGDSVFRAKIGDISQADLIRLDDGRSNPSIVGFYQYCDGLGTEAYHSFMLQYKNASNSRLNFTLLNDISLPPSLLRLAATIDPDNESISPCEPLIDKK